MLIPFWQELLISTLVLLVPMYLYFRSSGRSKNPGALPINWPVMHMFPSLLANVHNLLDYFTLVLAGSGLNFRAHGPGGAGMRFFVTCDPANIRHIFTKNYTNFPKGTEFAAIFDIMGDSLFNVDGPLALRPRAKIHTVLSSPRLVASMEASCRDKVVSDLLPLLSHMANTGTVFDIQELMSRFMFDLASTALFGEDPGLLSIDMPHMDVSIAMDTVMEVGFFRHMMPACCWKAMRWLNIGPERKLGAAHTILRDFIAKMIERRNINKGHVNSDHEQEGVDIFSSYINDPDFSDYDFLRAGLIGLMLALRDTVRTTLSWIFYNLAQNPDVVSTIRNELTPIALRKASTAVGDMVIFEPEEIKSMVYLRATLYETLRLYPPAPLERKTVATDDIMPSGHKVHSGDTIFVSIYSMGRMEGVWGKDCLNYNPHRWLLEDGKLRYVPSHKFLSFNSGPRICPGKDIAVMQMKIVVATIVWNFDVEVTEGQSIRPKSSCILQMKNGLTVKLKKR
ncbi:noroxomaritidine synthase 1-like [Hordeum vulgare subsp. vulgare]|uniref:noroxomaritidine synthase 1-like n=1 Tax=Hordeum vulgare subsp. vulgare TaxID=112509 RepID=UPI00029503D1|nr:noroxomaritidine synthase 1-like [Hordeum vulgare subsp. vulgare]XP_044948488.1 noroxomaritidine synthase 1-like [Hordeum vulgare subsp. vulgare]